MIALISGATNGVIEWNIPNFMWVVFVICLIVFALVLDIFFDRRNRGE